MKHEERQLHIALADWMRLALPADAVAYHPASGEKRVAKTAALLKRMMVVPGLPDFFVHWRGKCYAIEVKAAGGRLSSAQKEMHQRLTAAGVQVCVAYRFEAVPSFLTSVGIPLKVRVT